MGKVRWIWWPEPGEPGEPTWQKPEVYTDDQQHDDRWKQGGRWERVVIIPVTED
jgi:hypothetical protein